MVFIPKFTGHLRGLHIIGILSGTAILLAKMFGFLSNEEILKLCIDYKYIYLQCTHSGEVNLHILEFVLILLKTSISLSMLVLSTTAQKGGDCKSKVLPPCVLDIFGQNNR